MTVACQHVHGKFLICPSKAKAGRFKISFNRNEPKPHKHMANHGLIKTIFHPLFSQEKHLNPSARRVSTFLRPKKDFGGNETKSTAVQCKEAIIYSISSPLSLCHVQVKQSLLLDNFSLRSLKFA